jgi:hypothetical protein
MTLALCPLVPMYPEKSGYQYSSYSPERSAATSQGVRTNLFWSKELLEEFL